MTIKELYDRFTLAYPKELSCSWDHDGLMVCPDLTAKVTGVLTTLDVTDAAIDHALAVGANVIVSHHPFLFHPVGAVTPEHPLGEKIVKLIRAGISVFSFHTRADAAIGGVNDILANTLGLANVVVVGEEQIMRVGTLERAYTPEELAQKIKAVLGTPTVILASGGKPIRFLAVCGGESRSMAGVAKAGGADALLIGRAGYHSALDGADDGITIFEAGHFYTEVAITKAFADIASHAVDVPVEIYAEPPVVVY